MKSILKLVLPALAVILCGIQSANAQVDGYRFGVGLDYSINGGRFHNRFDRNFFGLPIAPTPRIDAPPFFALYPPVYYSDNIVSRPYGVSPFAAPPGIVPVEMGVAPVIQANPYYVDPGPPVDGQPVPDKGAGNNTSTQKTTWVRNPHYDPLATVGNIIASR